MVYLGYIFSVSMGLKSILHYVYKESKTHSTHHNILMSLKWYIYIYIPQTFKMLRTQRVILFYCTQVDWNSKYVFRHLNIHKNIKTRMKLIVLSTEHFKYELHFWSHKNRQIVLSRKWRTVIKQTINVTSMRNVESTILPNKILWSKNICTLRSQPCRIIFQQWNHTDWPDLCIIIYNSKFSGFITCFVFTWKQHRVVL